MHLVNGQPNALIDIRDCGFQYGDGLFETLSVLDGIPLYYSRHIARLKRGCQRLGILFTDFNALEQEVNSLCRESERAVIKIQITRGAGKTRGFKSAESVQPTRVVSLSPYPNYPKFLASEGIQTRLCHTRLGINPALAGIKHSNRLEQIIARAEWGNAEIWEGILLDAENFVVEGTMTNIFLATGNKLYTPAIDRCGVAGIMREIVIELALRNNVDLVEGRITLGQLLDADEFFLTNSIVEIWPVKQMGDRVYSIGPYAKRFIGWISECNERQRL